MTGGAPPDLAQLRARYAGAEPQALVAAMLTREFPGRIATVSSFGTESAVLLHMIAQVDPAAPVILIDTGKLFGETRRYRDQLIAHLGLTGVRDQAPDPAAVAEHDPRGVLWSQAPDACCGVRKVAPLAAALKPFAAWFTGRKTFQAVTRAALPAIEFDGTHYKINPLAAFSAADVDAYFVAHDLPRHPLEADGYRSIGCMPCTSPVAADEDPRAGRWRGQGKIECGIHRPLERVP
jgi:phosphoadenosine phosphosulfate reductase